jgi:hypothetical protein
MEHVRRRSMGLGGAVAAVQNNWITGIGGKLQRFRRHGLWFLDSEQDLQVNTLHLSAIERQPTVAHEHRSQEPVLALRLRGRAVDAEVGVLVERSAIAAAAAAARTVGMRVSLPTLCNYSGGSGQDDSCGPEEYFDCGNVELLPIVLPDTWPSAAAANQWTSRGGAVLDIISPDFPFVLHVPPSSSSRINLLRSALASPHSVPPYREELRRHVDSMLMQMQKYERDGCSEC